MKDLFCIVHLAHCMDSLTQKFIRTGRSPSRPLVNLDFKKYVPNSNLDDASLTVERFEIWIKKSFSVKNTSSGCYKGYVVILPVVDSNFLLHSNSQKKKYVNKKNM